MTLVYSYLDGLVGVNCVVAIQHANAVAMAVFMAVNVWAPPHPLATPHSTHTSPPAPHGHILAQPHPAWRCPPPHRIYYAHCPGLLYRFLWFGRPHCVYTLDICTNRLHVTTYHFTPHAADARTHTPPHTYITLLYVTLPFYLPFTLPAALPTPDACRPYSDLTQRSPYRHLHRHNYPHQVFGRCRHAFPCSYSTTHLPQLPHCAPSTHA